MTNIDAVAPLDESIAAQEQVVADTRAVLERQEAGLNTLKEARRLIDGQQNTAPGGAPTRTGTRVRTSAVTPDIDLSKVQVDFEGTENMLDRLVRIAETIPDTHLNVTQVVKLLIRHGQTGASVHNGRVSVQRAFNSNPSIFERAEAHRATYRYVGGGDPVANQTQATGDET